MESRVPHLIRRLTFKESTVLYSTCAHPVLSYRILTNYHDMFWKSGGILFVFGRPISKFCPSTVPVSVLAVNRMHMDFRTRQGTVLPVVAVLICESVNATRTGSV